MGLTCYKLFSVFIVIAGCFRFSVDAISNTQFNANLREYGANEDNNATNLQIKTLQKEETRKYSSFGPNRSSDVFKEIPDNALSSSSHSRGLLHHDHGYVVGEYDEIPPYAHGHDYAVHIPDYHQSHSFDTHYDHHDAGHHHHISPHHLNHGHHHKIYDHALAAKTLLWPIAGIALLGAAAALVSNPVLLQLGVVSGKRRRRDADTDSTPDLDKNPFQKPNNKDEKKIEVDTTNNDKQRILQWNLFKDIKSGTRTARSNISIRRMKDVNQYGDDDRYIPVPLQLKSGHP